MLLEFALINSSTEVAEVLLKGGTVLTSVHLFGYFSFPMPMLIRVMVDKIFSE